VNVVVPRPLPERGVKWNVTCVNDRGVENPTISTSNPEALREAILRREIVGAARFTVNVRLGAGDGVTSLPSL